MTLIYSQPNPIWVFVSNDQNYDNYDNSLINDYSDFNNDGELALVDADNKGVGGTNSSSGSKFLRIVQRRGTQLHYSPKIKSTDMATYKAGSAATQQISYIGYNGSSGEMDADDSTYYSISIKEEGIPVVNRTGQSLGSYTSDASATQYEIAKNLADSLDNNVNGILAANTSKKIKFELINNGAVGSNDECGAGGNNPTGNITFTKGSTTATMADSQDLSVGDFLRVTGAATETLKDPIYKITAIDSSGSPHEVTLDSPFKGSTGAVDDDYVHHVASGSIGTDWGIKCTGVDESSTYKVGQNYFYTRSFNIGLHENFSDATVTYDTDASEGIGTYEKVIEMEQFGYGNLGKYNDASIPSPTFSTEANSTDAVYDCITITVDNENSAPTGDQYKDKAYIHIFMSNSSTNDYNNDILSAGLVTFLDNVSSLKDY